MCQFFCFSQVAKVNIEIKGIDELDYSFVLEKTSKNVLEIEKFINYCKVTSFQPFKHSTSTQKPLLLKDPSKLNKLIPLSLSLPLKTKKKLKALTSVQRPLKPKVVCDPSPIPVDEPRVTSSSSPKVNINIISAQKAVKQKQCSNSSVTSINLSSSTCSSSNLCNNLTTLSSKAKYIVPPLVNEATTFLEKVNSINKLKPKEAMKIILNCKKVSNMKDILKYNLSNQTFLTLNNYEHKNIFCEWILNGHKTFNFKVFKNTVTDEFIVHHSKENISFHTNSVEIELISSLYKAKCGNDFIMQVFFTKRLKLIHFVGRKPSCKCINNHSSLFGNKQEVSSLKHKLISEGSVTKCKKFRKILPKSCCDPSLTSVDQPGKKNSSFFKANMSLTSAQTVLKPKQCSTSSSTPINSSNSTNSFSNLCNNLTTATPRTIMISQPLKPKAAFTKNIFSSINNKLKPVEAVKIMLNHNEVIEISDVLKQNFSNQTYITENNYDHTDICCQWVQIKDYNSKFNFKVFKKSGTDKFEVHHSSGKKSMNTDSDTIEVMGRLYKAKCGNDFNMQVFFTNNLKLIHFMGRKPDCKCINKNEQKNAILSNKDKGPKEIYSMYPKLFKNPQDISNLKRKLFSTKK